MSQPFHAGGAANHQLLDPLGVLRTLVSRWSEIDLTRAGSLVAIAGVAPSAWRFARGAWTELCTWIRHFFIASVNIPGRDPLNRSVISWVLDNVVEDRKIRFLTARTEAQLGRDDAAMLKKTRRSAQYLPHWETTWFWHEKNLFIVSRSLESFNASMCDPGYDGIGGEDLTISCIGRSADPIKGFIDMCREYADKKTQYFVTIYSRDRYGISWQPKSRKPIRHLDTVHFDSDVKDELLSDIRKYLDPKTQKRYRNRSMPYRRGYLFYGPPGTGKSSLSTALAGEFGLDLYEVKIPSVAADQDLEQMFQEIPPQCIVLLEDIDAVWMERDTMDRSDHSSMISNRSNCTLSGILNVLDGVGSQEGRIVIMTTNKPEHLDSALVRPGRVDMKVFLGNISQKSAKQMFIRMFSPDLDISNSPLRAEDIERLATEFSTHIPEDTFTPSQLQGFFQINLDSAVDAVLNVSAWVEKELSRKSADEGIEIVREAQQSDLQEA
ncbi:P-loop containing nucleoside triphosphate hydrolase protein [Xylariales sp. PMI_506]|nr:P-loop containing nucleoside triphosphate hydrolase protein [Xylariales sp. PMI_506]